VYVFNISNVQYLPAQVKENLNHYRVVFNGNGYTYIGN